MREPLIPMTAYERDVRDGSRWVGHPTQPHGWFSLTHIAYRLASLPLASRGGFLATLPDDLLPDRERRPTHVDHLAEPASDPMVAAARRLRVAAEDMERDGCFEMAFTTVSSAARLVASIDASESLCALTHMARIARQLGEIAEAESMYADAEREALQRGFPSIAGYAAAGLGNMAIMRGNRPAQLLHFTDALQLAPVGSTLEAVARWGLMNYALATESLADALIHGWRAFDLSTSDEERAGILSNLASVAHRARFLDAAIAGFEGALRMAKPTRLWLSIAASAAQVAGERYRSDILLRLEEDGRRRSAPLVPFERSQWLLGLAQGWADAGSSRAATHFALEGRHLAQSHEFHELTYRSDELLDRLTAEPAGATPMTDAAPNVALLPEVTQKGLARLCAVAQ